jgi:short-subunit dehydrogenase
VARSFAREGTHVFLAGRTVAKVEAVAEGGRGGESGDTHGFG